MPATSRHVLQVRGKEKVAAERLDLDNCKLSLTNFLAGGDLVVPKASTWATKRASTRTEPQTIIIKADDVDHQLVFEDSTDAGDLTPCETSDDQDECDDSEESETSALLKSKRAQTAKNNKKASEEKCLKKSKDSSTTVCLKKKGIKPKSGKNENQVQSLKNSELDDSTDSKVKKVSKDKRRSDKKTVTIDGETSQVTDKTSENSPGMKKNKMDTPAYDTTDFTPSQDALILSMKAGGETWADIGKAISRGKHEVQKRWKELSAAVSDNEADTKAASPKRGGEKQPKTKPAGSSSRSTTSSGSSASSDSESSGNAAARATVARLRGLYGGRAKKKEDGGRRMEPDDEFGELDCQVLALLESKMRAERWLELQAAFFNTTGRMVPEEVLRRKVEEAGLNCEGEESS